MNTLHKSTYGVLDLFSRWLSLMPDRTRERLAIRLANILYNYIPLRKVDALDNIRRAFPEKAAEWHVHILRESYQFFLKLMLLFFAMPAKFPSLKIHVTGKHHLDDALAQKKGVVMVSGHFGAWEVFAAWTGYSGYPVVPVAVKQKNRGADKFFTDLRGQAGIVPIYRKESLDNMYEVLVNNNLLALGSDQDARSHGVFVNFFNIPSSTPKGAALFHLNTGCPIVFGICHAAGSEYFLEFETIQVFPGDGVKEITQRYTSLLEQHVRRNPEQYFWWHRRWKTKPPTK